MIKKIILAINVIINSLKQQENHLLLLGKFLSKDYKNKKIDSIEETEFKVFSQFGEDGIIQYLIQNLDIKEKTFCEFGVEDYRESNTRFLLMNNYWTGLVLDGSKSNINKIKNSEYYWKYNLEAQEVFITKDNINKILENKFGKKIGILSLDIDGVDYWILKEINIDADILVVEYNSIFGKDKSLTVPYKENFARQKEHYSKLYFGASITAFTDLANSKGYALVGGTTSGNNLFFVKRNLLNEKVIEKSVEGVYRISSFNEGLDVKGRSLHKSEAYNQIVGMEVFNLKSNSYEKIN